MSHYWGIMKTKSCMADGNVINRAWETESCRLSSGVLIILLRKGLLIIQEGTGRAPLYPADA